MKIVSVTISSDSKENIIGDALKSVSGFVDYFIILHLLNLGTDNTIDVARQICGDRLRIFDCDLSDFPRITEWRNEVLRLAGDINPGGWACMLDTDERIILNGADIRKNLHGVRDEVDCINIFENTDRYDKCRFFRLPVTGRYEGSHGKHEVFVGNKKTIAFDTVRFCELEKTQEVLRSRLIHDVAGLLEQIKIDPSNPRWRFLLASTYDAMERYEEARDAYLDADRYVDSRDTLQRGLCFYGAACASIRISDGHAKKIALTGLTISPELTELWWLLSLISLNDGDNRNAIAYARACEALSDAIRKDGVVRTGLKEPIAHYEGPYIIMAEAYKRIGEHGLSRWAESKRDLIRKDRKNRV